MTVKARYKGLPKISIITPSFNQGQFIEETIKSILDQNYPNLEFWVMDGGSNDSTVSILKKYGDRIKWVSQPDKGQTDALNKGLHKITGDIIAYINSDDAYLPNTLHTVAEYFEKNPGCDWLTGDYFIIDERGQKMQSWIANYKKILRLHPNRNTLAVANYIAQPSTFWSKAAFKKVGFFNDKLRYCMDFEYWLRLMEQYQLHVSDRHFSLFRIHGQSKGGAQYVKQFREEHQVVNTFITNPIVRLLHAVHAEMIILIYKLIK
jgi:glycosyltransferase involved in cell wall biosynthesis